MLLHAFPPPCSAPSLSTHSDLTSACLPPQVLASVGFASTSVSVEESARSVTLKVQLATEAVNPVTVAYMAYMAYAAVSSTATAADYQLQPGTLRFERAEKSKVGPTAACSSSAVGTDSRGWGRGWS